MLSCPNLRVFQFNQKNRQPCLTLPITTQAVRGRHELYTAIFDEHLFLIYKEVRSTIAPEITVADILFNMYVNQLPCIHRHTNILKYLMCLLVTNN